MDGLPETVPDLARADDETDGLPETVPDLARADDETDGSPEAVADVAPDVLRGRGAGSGRRAGRGRGAGRMVGARQGVARGVARGVALNRGVGSVPLPAGWRKSADVPPPNIHDFTERSGPTTVLAAGSEPIGFFHQIFGTDFFEQLAEATNMNAVAKSPPPQGVAHARLATSDGAWRPTTAAEMQAYIGVNMAMGFKDMPEYKDY